MAITRAQAAVHAVNALTGTTLNVTYNGIAAASLVCVWTSNDTSGTVGTITVKDDLAVSATARGSTGAAGFNQNTSIFYFANYGGGNRVITQTLSVTHTARTILAQELAGAASSPADGVASSAGTSTTPTSTALVPAPSVNGTYIFAACNCANLPTFVAPFSDIFQDSNTAGDAEDLIQGTAASISATWTQVSGAWQALAASFQPAAAASTSAPGNTTKFLMLLGLGT